LASGVPSSDAGGRGKGAGVVAAKTQANFQHSLFPGMSGLHFTAVGVVFGPLRGRGPPSTAAATTAVLRG